MAAVFEWRVGIIRQVPVYTLSEDIGARERGRGLALFATNLASQRQKKRLVTVWIRSTHLHKTVDVQPALSNSAIVLSKDGGGGRVGDLVVGPVFSPLRTAPQFSPTLI